MTKGRKVYEKIRSVADAALFFDDVCMYWATGFYSTDGVVIVDREATKLCVDSRYYEAACNAKESGALFDDVEVILLDKGVVRRGFRTCDRGASGTSQKGVRRQDRRHAGKHMQRPAYDKVA